MSSKILSTASLNALVETADRSPRRRQSLTLHLTSDETCQRLVNAIGIDSYVRPHRHLLDPKLETLIAIRGRFVLVTFTDEGEVEEVIHFHTEKHEAHHDSGIGVEIPSGTWLTIIATEPESIMLEIKAGPFRVELSKEPALWAPAEETTEGQEYLGELKKRIGLG